MRALPLAVLLLLLPDPPGPPPPEFVRLLVEGARISVTRAPRYDPAYVPLEFPGGDPGWERGACTDLVIRAFRHAGIDLQVVLARDVAARRKAYGIVRLDPSIDHRRVRNLRVLLERRATRLPSGPEAEWLPGDLVIWDLYGGTSPNHIGIVSDRRGESGRPLVIHHFREWQGYPGRPTEDDCLRRWRILGHYRWTGGKETAPGPGSGARQLREPE